MLHYIAQAMRPTLEGLGFMDSFVGATRTMRLLSVVYYNDMPVQEVEIIPVGITDTCDPTNLDQLRRITPNDAYGCVAWLKEDSPAHPVTDAKPGPLSVRVEFSLVSWINRHKIGDMEKYGQGLEQLQVLKAFENFDKAVTVEGFSVPVGVKVRVKSVAPNDHDQVFAGYSFAANNHAFVYPFEFFRVYMTAIVTLPMSCFCYEAGERAVCREW